RGERIQQDPPPGDGAPFLLSGLGEASATSLTGLCQGILHRSARPVRYPAGQAPSQFRALAHPADSDLPHAARV
ncbi:MAG: hypothetical protein AAFY19_06410, partial [Pseudomonadota bacterium]